MPLIQKHTSRIQAPPYLILITTNEEPDLSDSIFKEHNFYYACPATVGYNRSSGLPDQAFFLVGQSKACERSPLLIPSEWAAVHRFAKLQPPETLSGCGNLLRGLFLFFVSVLYWCFRLASKYNFTILFLI